jgi:aminomethyltransferase
MELKKTALYEQHVTAGGKMVSFAGFAMPVRYSGDTPEHLAVRNKAGLFDVSHMGEVIFRGPGAFEALQKLITNDLAKIGPGRVLYSPMCYHNGTTVDDLLVYCYSTEHYFVCVNASNTDKDFAWMVEQSGRVCTVENHSENYAQIAIQGPAARAIADRVFASSPEVAGLKRFRFVVVDYAGVEALVSRTGYTGEDGLEIYLPPTAAPALWRELLEAGAEDGLIPCGLGARDSLRLEAALPLYGHELSNEITPLEAGIGWTVKPDKGEFNGRAVLAEQKAHGAPRQLVGLVTTERRAIPRQGYHVYAGDQPVGTVTSGLFSPYLKQGIGLALVTSGSFSEGDETGLEVRGTRFAARIVPLPFVQKK